MPLGLSGVAFSSTVFLSKYQVWFLALGVVALVVAHYVAVKGRSLVRTFHKRVLWASTVLNAVAIGYYLYSSYYFLVI